MTRTDADVVVGAAAILRDVIQPLVDRLDAFEARLAAIEQRPLGVIDGGIWTAGTVYARGTGTTHRGAFWIAQRETRREPADGNDDWRLAVSRGQRGKQGPAGRDGDAARDIHELAPAELR